MVLELKATINTKNYFIFDFMYSKQQASELKKEFWTALGRYLTPVLSAEGEKINWINYKTGEKHISFKMFADNKYATIIIEISHPDIVIQQLYFEQFVELKTVLHNTLEEEWEWRLHIMNESGKTISTISKNLDQVSIFKKEDWPALISFFKPRMIALDDFWSSFKYSFEALK